MKRSARTSASHEIATTRKGVLIPWPTVRCWMRRGTIIAAMVLSHLAGYLLGTGERVVGILSGSSASCESGSEEGSDAGGRAGR